MTITAADFLSAFPEFNTSAYQVSQINFWIPQAYNQLNACRFGVTLDLAAMLFVAHNLALGARDAAISANGGISGQSSGPLTSKSVSKVSAGYDTGANQSPGAGMWNATSYGQRLYRMMIANGGFMYFPPDTMGTWLGNAAEGNLNVWPTPNWQFIP